MKTLSAPELKTLLEDTGNPAVSIYLPTHPAGDNEQDHIRLKNLLRPAEEQLVGYGLRPTEARDFLDPARRLLPDMEFWQHQGAGLAVFISPGLFRYYRVPYEFPELVVAAGSFHLTPLLPLFLEDGRFYILAISQNRVRLLQCTRYHVRDITPPGVPSSLAEALKYDEPEKQHRFHTVGPASPAIFHGQGIPKDADKVNTLRYFQQVDRGLHEALRDERAPLIVAAVDYLHPIYREANTYQPLLDEGLRGNPDGWSETQLREEGWRLLEPYFARRRDEAAARYREALSKGLAANEMKAAVLAAYDGRIDTLLVSPDVQQWGEFDPDSREVRLYPEKRPGARDLLDYVATSTLAKGGVVYALKPAEMPCAAPVAALLRY